MKRQPVFFTFAFLVILFLTAVCIAGECNRCNTSSQSKWKIHDNSRPRPNIIEPGTFSTQNQPGKPPSDAVVLFNGEDLEAWRAMNGESAKWIVKDGCMECVRGSGYIRTLRNFGSCQLHVEFATPTPARGSSQGRGNSGVFLMGLYEVQVLDSYQNETYADGQAAAVYGQYPPLVNACRPPGMWQSYDIIFHVPRFNQQGDLTEPARMTVLHNGVLVQDNVELLGPTDWMRRIPYKAHRDKLPLSLQDHGNPVRYRNIWIRELPDPYLGGELRKEISPAENLLDKYAGQYHLNPREVITIEKKNNALFGKVHGNIAYDLYAETETLFYMKEVEVEIEFHLDKDGNVTGLTRRIHGGGAEAKRIE